VFASRAVIGTQAHVGGVPVEETVLALAPVAWALLIGGRVAAGRARQYVVRTRARRGLGGLRLTQRMAKGADGWRTSR
jgi:hypothetical protein